MFGKKVKVKCSVDENKVKEVVDMEKQEYTISEVVEALGNMDEKTSEKLQVWKITELMELMNNKETFDNYIAQMKAYISLYTDCIEGLRLLSDELMFPKQISAAEVITDMKNCYKQMDDESQKQFCDIMMEDMGFMLKASNSMLSKSLTMLRPFMN